MGGTRGSGVLSSAGDMLEISMVRVHASKYFEKFE